MTKRYNVKKLKVNFSGLLNHHVFSSQDENKAKDKKGELNFITVHATWLHIIQGLVWTFFSSLQGSVLYEALLSSFFSVNRVVINFFRLIGKYFEKDSPFDKTVTTTIVRNYLLHHKLLFVLRTLILTYFRAGLKIRWVNVFGVSFCLILWNEMLVFT